MIAYICFVLLIIFLFWFKSCLSSIESNVSSISNKLISSLDKTDLSDIERHLSSIDSELSRLSLDKTDLSDIERHLSSIDSELSRLSLDKTDLSDIESDLSSIKEGLGGSLAESIEDKLDEIIVKLEELIEKR